MRDWLFASERPEYRRGFQCSRVKEYLEVSCKVVFLLQVFFWIVSLSLCLTGLKSIKWDKSFTATLTGCCLCHSYHLTIRQSETWISSMSYRWTLGKYKSHGLRPFLGQKDLERSFGRGVVHRKLRASTFSKGVWYRERCSTWSVADTLYYTVIDFPFLSSHLHFFAFCFLANKDKESLKSKEIICPILKYQVKIVHFFVSKSGVHGRKKKSLDIPTKYQKPASEKIWSWNH